MAREPARSSCDTNERIEARSFDPRGSGRRRTSTAPGPERYELLFELASGGMGTVYVGRRLGAGGFQRIVAIKRMRATLAEDPSAVAAFHEEARIASLVQHNNVVAIHDVHRQGDEHFLVMDYVEGVSLSQLLRKLRGLEKRLTRDVGLRIVFDALLGLHAAHELCDHDGRPLELVHRDATPHNILIGTDGSVRLTDFGIARAVFRGAGTDPGCARGKFAYMAPEHAFAEPLDRRADIFAVGVVLWEVLTGRRLFQNRTIREVARGTALGKIPRPSERGAACPTELDDLVLRALAPWKDDRYATAMEFADAIDAFASRSGGLPPTNTIAEVVELVCGDDVQDRARQLREALKEKAPSLVSSSTVRRKVRPEALARKSLLPTVPAPMRPPDDSTPVTSPVPSRFHRRSHSAVDGLEPASVDRPRARWGRFAAVVLAASVWAMVAGILVGRFASESVRVAPLKRFTGPALLLAADVRQNALRSSGEPSDLPASSDLPER